MPSPSRDRLVVAVASGLFAVGVNALPAHGAGSGMFVETEQVFGLGEGTLAVALGDLDGDGDLDALTPTYVGPALRWINDGRGQFSAGVPVGSISGTTIELADFDGDGDVDVFHASATGATQVYLNDGLGAMTGVGPLFPHIGPGAATGDLDGDGDLDILAGTIGGWTNSAMLNDGAGLLTVFGGLNGVSARGLAVGDLDGDGDLDAYITRQGHDGVLINDGTGVFADSGQQLDDAYGDHVALGDLDGDGDLDAFIANTDLFVSNPPNTVWFNDGTGAFTDSGQLLGSNDTTHVALGDIDDDGDLDAVIAQPFVPNEIWVNDGTGHFGLGATFGGIEQDRQLALGDLDGDGDLDIFANGGGTGERVYLNQNATCTADVDDNGVVDFADVLAVIAAWGSNDPDADVDASGIVGFGDVLAVVGAWGTC